MSVLQVEDVCQERPAEDKEGDQQSFRYDLLLEWLQSGRFGGRPQSGDGPIVLIEVLRRLGWKIDYRCLSDAVPHFADTFDIDEVRSTLARLGYRTRIVLARGRKLHQLRGLLVVLLPSGRLGLPAQEGSDRARLTDPQTGRPISIRRGQLYTCILEDRLRSEVAAQQQLSWRVAMGHRFYPELRTILLLTTLSNFLVLVGSFSIGLIFDIVLPAEALDTLVAVLLGIAAALLLELRLRAVRARVVGRVAGRLEFITSTTLFSKLLSLPVEMLTSVPAGDQVGRLRQFESIREVFCGPVVALAFEFPFLVLMVLVLFAVDPLIGGVVLGLIAVHLALGATIYPRLRSSVLATSHRRSEYERLLKEAVSTRGEIVRRGLASVWKSRLAMKYGLLMQARTRMEDTLRLLNNVMSVAMPLATGAVVVIGAWRAIEGSLSGGSLIVCTILVNRLLGPVQQALLVAVRIPEITAVLSQIDAMRKLPSVSQKGKGQIGPSTGRIRMEEVALRYANGAEPALKGVSVQIEDGSFVCVGGASGAGKSSLLRVIAGLYRPQAGGVYIDGVNVGQLSSADRSTLIGYLGHSPLRMHGTIEQYLRLAVPSASPQELESVCSELGLLSTIHKMPGGLSCRLDHVAWSRLPVSFRTRLAVAQLLLKAPKVLLLDEPEAGLSPDDEQHLLSAIYKRRGQLTCLMVTHRPSTMRTADQVVIMQAGKIRYFGSAEKLSF